MQRELDVRLNRASEDKAAALAEFARQLGFDISVAEASRQLLANARALAQDELSDEDLSRVSGGASSLPSGTQVSPSQVKVRVDP